jgi:hypothetical protein
MGATKSGKIIKKSQQTWHCHVVKVTLFPTFAPVALQAGFSLFSHPASSSIQESSIYNVLCRLSLTLTPCVWLLALFNLHCKQNFWQRKVTKSQHEGDRCDSGNERFFRQSAVCMSVPVNRLLFLLVGLIPGNCEHEERDQRGQGTQPT